MEKTTATTNLLTLTQSDFERLNSLVATVHSEAAELLEEEIGRAAVVPDEALPADVVSMNSTVTFEDISTGKKSEVTLVFPNEADVDEGKVSILAPVGSALIGLKVGQTIKWPLPGGREKQLRVMAVRR